jgi:hypothetical protein
LTFANPALLSSSETWVNNKKLKKKKKQAIISESAQCQKASIGGIYFKKTWVV